MTSPTFAARPPRPAPGRRLAALAAIALGACRAAQEAPMAPPPPALRVETAVAAVRPMPRRLPLTGSLIADQQADIAANASGRVDRTRVERGSEVALGAPLVELDTRSSGFSDHEARANLDIAVAKEALAGEACRRNRKLFERGAISKDEWDRIDSACRTSTADAAAARARANHSATALQDATVRAPFAGVVQDRYVSVGEYVQPQTRVVTLVSATPLRLQLTVAEADVARVAMGQRATFEVEAYRGERFVGTVAYVDPAVRQASRDIRVDALVDNADRRLRAGMSATAWLEQPDAPSVAVPESALRGAGLEARVYVVAGDRLSERRVQPGARRGGFVEILDGLGEGDRLVVALTAEVKDGARVE